MNIVLLEPEIPLNTGNIGRTCAAVGATLHLIKPLGFSIDDKAVKRAGMDYWKDVDLKCYENFAHFINENALVGSNISNLYLATTKARRLYTEVSYGMDCYIMFGKESAGLPEEILVEHEPCCIRIPMLEKSRSLNLSNSAAVVLYEALRQNSFDGLALSGELHRLKWDYEI